MAHDKDLFSSEDLPEEGATGAGATLPPPPPPPDEDLPPPPGELFKSSDEPEGDSKLGEFPTGGFPKVELPTWPPAPMSDTLSTPPEPESTLPPLSPSPFGDPAPPASAAGEPAAGAHLSLPSIDFSMPSFDIGARSTSGAPPAEPRGDLPAHLSLPSFPEFELPPIPGQEKKIDIEGMAGGSFGLADASPTPAVSGGMSPDEWQVQTPGGGPPPPPPPPRRKKKSEELPDLPQMGLSEIAQKKKPALLHSDAQIDIHAVGKKRLSLPVVLAALLVVALLGAVAAVIYFGPKQVLAYFRPEVTQEVELSAEQKAEKSFIEGFEVYKVAEEAEKAKNPREAQRKFKEAIVLFERAVTFDPAMDKAHRSLGISFAKVKEHDKAVGHYRKYLELAPNAADAAKVRKFVSDYETAQKGKRKR